ncbi:MAG TPA: Rieske 2Fe-2S domain-containing protein [Abditibacteriaceae bacterium]|nr:Rieske 2Fe-2S domain-containing protein [Abditibacteriaceae bacterium]
MNYELSRRDFLRSLAGAAGVMVIGAGCSTEGESTTSAPDGHAPPLLAAVKNPDGSFRVPGGGKLAPGMGLVFALPPDNAPAIVFLTAKGELRALSAKCTHTGCTVNFESKGGQEHLPCRCHGSNFDSDGRVLKGPAKRPLPVYKVRREGDDAVITL